MLLSFSFCFLIYILSLTSAFFSPSFLSFLITALSCQNTPTSFCYLVLPKRLLCQQLNCIKYYFSIPRKKKSTVRDRIFLFDAYMDLFHFPSYLEIGSPAACFFHFFHDSSHFTSRYPARATVFPHQNPLEM